MTEIIPAILAKNFEDLQEKTSKFVSISNIVQIDICDGLFVSSYSWPMNLKDDDSFLKIINEENGMPFWENIDFELDLMVKDAIDKFNLFIKLGIKRIIFHYEAEDKDRLENFIKGLDLYTREHLEIGVAIGNDTPIENLEKIISNVDFIQCMGIKNIGFQGQEFDERVLDRIKKLKTKYPELIISVDGSVNENTAKELILAGANRLVIGSALLNSHDIKEKINYFENL